MHKILNSLSNLPPSIQAPPLLLLGHKADLLPLASTSKEKGKGSPNTNLAISRLKTILERELEKRRLSALTTTNADTENDPDAADGEGDGTSGLDIGEKGPFTFEKWWGEIDILGSYIKFDEDEDKK